MMLPNIYSGACISQVLSVFQETISKPSYWTLFIPESLQLGEKIIPMRQKNFKSIKSTGTMRN